MKHFFHFYFLMFALFLSFVPVYGQIRSKTWQYAGPNGPVNMVKIPLKQTSGSAYEGPERRNSYAVIDMKEIHTFDIRPAQNEGLKFDNRLTDILPLPESSKIKTVSSQIEASINPYHPAHVTGKMPIAVQAVYTLGSRANREIDSIASILSYNAFASDSLKYNLRALFKQTGAVWGLAYDRQHRTLFSTALVKRFSDLGDLGSGGIYLTDLENNNTKPFLNLDAMGFATGNKLIKRDLSANWEMASHDSLVFSQVGKVGLGGVDISEDSRYLYTINLYDRHLYRIAIRSVTNPHDSMRFTPIPVSITRFPIPVNTYKGGAARPFAVKYHSGKVYAGVIYDAQSSQKVEDLQAIIYVINADEVDPAKTKFKEVTHFPLNYTRGTLDYGVKGWFPWTDNYLQTLVPGQPGWMIYPQPIIADIEFDVDGSMIVSLMDRLGHQTGDGQLYRPDSKSSFLTARGLSGGDVLRLGKTKKNFQTEQNGRVGTLVSAGQSNGEGPGGGEFYVQDSFTSSGTTWHQETATGGLAILPESNSLLVSVREPDQYATGGVKWFDNKTGVATHALSIFPGGMKPGYN